MKTRYPLHPVMPLLAPILAAVPPRLRSPLGAPAAYRLPDGTSDPEDDDDVAPIPLHGSEQAFSA